MFPKMIFVIGCSMISVVLASLGQCEDWPRFRGPNGTGVNSRSTIPDKFGPEINVLWKVQPGSGTSSPIVANNRLVLTSFDDDMRSVACFDANNGLSIWRYDLPKTHDEPGTKPHGPATCTPATDGESVVAFFPDAGLVCLDFDGRHRWTTAVGPFHSMHGISSSPIIVGDKVIIVADQLSGSFIAAYELQTGKQAWKSERIDGLTGGYSTPSVLHNPEGTDQVIASGPREVIAYDAASGEVQWTVSGVTNAPVSVPVVSGNHLFVCEPVGTAAPMSQLSAPFDRDKDGKISLEEVKDNIAISRMLKRLDEQYGDSDGAVVESEWDKAFGGFVNKGGLVAIDLTAPETGDQSSVAWTYRKKVPYVPSTIVYQEALYFVQTGGILTVVNPRDGEELYRGRLDKGRQFYASPVAADGKILFVDTSGNMSVVRAGKQWELLDTIAFDERCDATPAIVGDRLYVRTETTLYCFGDP